MHTLEPGTVENLPASHVVHDVAPALDAISPALHSTQCASLVTGFAAAPNLPAAQLKQLSMKCVHVLFGPTPSTGWYVPTTQSAQKPADVMEAASRAWPAEQHVQLSHSLLPV
jgi:hypothetical protein